MKLSEIKEILKADVLLGEDMIETDILAGAGSDLMSDLLRGPKNGVVVLSGLNTIHIIRTAVVAEVAAVVLVRGKKPEPEMIDLARSHNLPLLSTPFTMFTACGRLFGKGLRGVEKKESG